jgi:hypothetical protein
MFANFTTLDKFDVYINPMHVVKIHEPNDRSKHVYISMIVPEASVYVAENIEYVIHALEYENPLVDISRGIGAR